jgi:formamidopyrimidine-DNA glycosylase
MPELPEVENVKLSLERLGVPGQVFERVELRRADLRTPLKKEMTRRLPGQRLRAIRRRAKYILFETEDFLLLNHLGMTGSWRAAGPGGGAGEDRRPHDHVVLHFASGLRLIFNDPRRFGLLELSAKDRVPSQLARLGLEPLSAEFTATRLFEDTRRVKAPIKNFIMDQRRVVGVGNIYASEALFAAGIRPTRPAGRLTHKEAEGLTETIQSVLRDAIAAGGSTIRDYRNSEGEAGSFQKRFAVYDREGQPCRRCGTSLKARILAGRNTFWCAKCQR